MKKIIACFFVLAAFASAAFSESIGKRFFEVRTDIPVGVYNNAFAPGDFMIPEVVIDFAKLRDDLGKDGMVVGFETKPTVAMNFNILGVHVGFVSGVESYGNLNLGRDLFDFIADGNKLNEEISFSAGGFFDTYVYESIDVKVETKKFTIGITPSIFTPVEHAEVSNAKLSVLNDEEGTFNIDGKLNVLVQSAYADTTLNQNQYTSNISDLLNNGGLDLGLSLKYPLFLGLKLNGFVQVPLLPAKLKSEMKAEGSISYKQNFLDQSKSDTEPLVNWNADMVAAPCVATINRPLSVLAGVEWSVFKEAIRLRGDVGMGAKYPFSAKQVLYPQYKFSAFARAANVIGAEVSTEYTKQMFKHEAQLMINIRLMELDLGVSLYGSDFVSSLEGKGFGGFLTFCFGF